MREGRLLVCLGKQGAGHVFSCFCREGEETYYLLALINFNSLSSKKKSACACVRVDNKAGIDLGR